MRADFKARFDALCRDCVSLCDLRDSDGIGTYQEKPLHKMLKRAVTDDASCFEVRVGNYVADVREQGRIEEIQTGGFYPLADKLRYFLDETEDEITVVHPIDAELTVIRVDPETGEVLSHKRSPKHESVRDVLPELFYLRHVFPSPRLNICIVSLRAEEYR